MSELALLKKIPGKPVSGDILSFLQNNNVTGKYLQLIKTFTRFKDEYISSLMDMNIKTYRKYLSDKSPLISNLQKEHIITILSLFKRGKEVFGDVNSFVEWLNKENFYFDKKAPIEFLETISGIKFIDDNLSGIQYGDSA